MSNCGCNSSNNCNPCEQTYSQESVASQLANLTYELFGLVTKTVTNGRAVWSTPCSPDDSIPAFPRGADEGFICYILRVLPLLGIILRGNWDVGDDYNAGDIVTYNQYYWYRALVDNSGVTPGTDPSVWVLVLTGVPGPAGPSTGASDNTQVVNTTPFGVPDDAGVLFCEPAADMVINLLQISALDPGKWYEIQTNSDTYTVTVNAGAGDTFEGGATSFVLSTAGSNLKIRSVTGSTVWRVS